MSLLVKSDTDRKLLGKEQLAHLKKTYKAINWRNLIEDANYFLLVIVAALLVFASFLLRKYFLLKQDSPARIITLNLTGVDTIFVLISVILLVRIAKKKTTGNMSRAFFWLAIALLVCGPVKGLLAIIEGITRVEYITLLVELSRITGGLLLLVSSLLLYFGFAAPRQDS